MRRHRQALAGWGTAPRATWGQAIRREIDFIRLSEKLYAAPLALGLLGLAFAVWWHAGSRWVAGAAVLASGVLMAGSKHRNH